MWQCPRESIIYSATYITRTTQFMSILCLRERLFIPSTPSHRLSVPSVNGCLSFHGYEPAHKPIPHPLVSLSLIGGLDDRALDENEAPIPIIPCSIRLYWIRPVCEHRSQKRRHGYCILSPASTLIISEWVPSPCTLCWLVLCSHRWTPGEGLLQLKRIHF